MSLKDGCRTAGMTHAWVSFSLLELCVLWHKGVKIGKVPTFWEAKTFYSGRKRKEEWPSKNGYRLQNLSIQSAQPWGKCCKVGCVSQVTSEFSFGLLEGSPWGVGQELGAHPAVQLGGCSELCSGIRLCQLKTKPFNYWVPECLGVSLKLSEYFLNPEGVKKYGQPTA